MFWSRRDYLHLKDSCDYKCLLQINCSVLIAVAVILVLVVDMITSIQVSPALKICVQAVFSSAKLQAACSSGVHLLLNAVGF